MELKYQILFTGGFAYFLINIMVLIIWIGDYFDSINNFGYDEDFTAWLFFRIIAIIFLFAIPMIIFVIGQEIWEKTREKMVVKK